MTLPITSGSDKREKKMTQMDAEEAVEVLRNEAERILDDAMKALEDVYEENGGDAWLDCEPRWHYFKGIDEFFSANHHSNGGDIEDMDENLKHGLNHILMASYVAHEPQYLSDFEEDMG